MLQKTQIKPEALNVASQMILMEVDLTGTDEDRKAAIAEFETKWKALTGSDDLQGVRFVGKVAWDYGEDGTERAAHGVFTYNIGDDGSDYYGYFGVVQGMELGYTSPIASVKLDLDSAHEQQLTITPLATKEDIDNTNKLANAVKSLGAIELNMSTASNATNKTTLTTYKKILTDAGVTISKGYSASIRLVNGSNEYFGTLNIGTGTLLGGIVTDINESKHYPINVNTSTGEVTFSADNYFLEKTSNEVQEMLDAIKYSQTHVPFTDTTLSNKAQLEVFLSKVPTAEVMHCTYNDIYAGTLHKINGDWFGQLVKNTNNYEDCICIKLAADGTITEGTTSLQSVSEQLDEIIG